MNPIDAGARRESEIDRLTDRQIGQHLELPDPEPLSEFFRWAVQN